MVKKISDHFANTLGIISFFLIVVGATWQNIIVICVCILTFIGFIVAHIFDWIRLKHKVEDMSEQKSKDDKQIQDLTDELTTSNDDLESKKEELKKVENYRNNVESLYKSAKKENDQYAKEQLAFQNLLSAKNTTFGIFVFRQLEVLEDPKPIIKLLHEFKIDPGRDPELVQYGLDAVNEVVKLRKEIDALEIKGDTIDEPK